jgi:molybdate transport repressor ModE-like protein
MARTDRLARRLRLRDFRMVEAVARHGSMARAAEDLGLSQPAISKAIADLERDLDAAVFDRNTRGSSHGKRGDIASTRACHSR